ncbi:helix-turn-helix domain-containing protein [Streptomyces sp. NBC_01198]|uniref:helix-turn-helix domain-containing protein n=1 Tax=Streptomyces sp. NBC_01198 TaxID=2903769 RepID=UPI002E0E918C|nr:helix-turn-helix domain-containing protein [Streptomyces sp. NBC_01198]
MGEAERRMAVRDVRALTSLGHPLRLRLLHHLLAAGPRTAAQCAEALHDTGANCGYHLRNLARFGLVERAEPDGQDRRERPWRASATGFDFLPDLESEQAEEIGATLSSLQLNEVFRAMREYLELAGRLPEEWQSSAAFNNYALMLTAEELAHLVVTLDAVIRPYIRATRKYVPPDARPVNLSVQAHLNPECL